MEKRCPKCGEIKSIDEFNNNRAHEDGKDNWCMTCKKEYDKEYTQKNPLLSTWRSMWSRCYNVNRKDYRSYGGCGITVCDEWEDYKTFEKFMLDNGWKPGMSVDRIANDKGYYPSNCRVIPKSQNHRGKRHISKWIRVKHSTPIVSLVYA